MAKARRVTKRALNRAATDALAGRTDQAMAAFGWMAELGSASAAASLAELSAFRGDWGGVVTHAALLIAEPTAVYAGNVFDDMVRLLGCAGREGGSWDRIGQSAQHGLVQIEANEQREHLRTRQGTILQALIAYAAREGAPPHELIRVFGVADEECEPDAYRDAVDNVLTLRPRLKGKPDALAQHLFALAVTFGQPDDIVERFFARPDLMDFDNAVEAARILLDGGEHDRAWAILEARLGQWWPLDDAQVAPVGLLTDAKLCALMTPARRATVLATARGPAVARPSP